MKALIIDDSPVMCKIIKGILLGSCGFTEVVLKENGSTGLKELMDNCCTYDLMVLDWYMPVMDGIEVLLAIRDSGISIPVIICTSADDKESIINAVTAGANDYLIKPFDPGTMQPKVGGVINAYKARRRKINENRVLVIDDSEIVRLAIEKILLNDVNVDTVVFAEDGVSALAIFKQQKFNLLLLDWQMPKMDGLQVLKEIRKTDATTPVIMATGNSEIEHMVSAFDAGATNFIPKPFKKEDLIAKVSQQLHVNDGTVSQRQPGKIEVFNEDNNGNDCATASDSDAGGLYLSDSTKFEKFIEIKWMRAFRMSREVAMVLMELEDSEQDADIAVQSNMENALQKVSDILLTNVRKSSVTLCRYNQTSWGVFFPDTSYDDVHLFVQNVTSDVRKMELGKNNSYRTLVVGAVVLVPRGPDDRFAVAEKAQNNLSTAKEQGTQYKITR